jgi:hypothetical protein
VLLNPSFEARSPVVVGPAQGGVPRWQGILLGAVNGVFPASHPSNDHITIGGAAAIAGRRHIAEFRDLILLPLSPASATAILGGLRLACDGFRNANEDHLELAAELLEAGANPEDAAELTREQLDIDRVRALGRTLQTAAVSKGVVTGFAPAGVDPTGFAHVLLEVEGSKIAVCLEPIEGGAKPHIEGEGAEAALAKLGAFIGGSSQDEIVEAVLAACGTE